MGWDGVGREKNKPSERGAMEWRAGKAMRMDMTTTCVSCLEDDNECMMYVSYIVRKENCRESTSALEPQSILTRPGSKKSSTN